MSAFLVNTNVMAKVVTAILLNFDTFNGESTCRVKLLAAPTDAQKEIGTKIARKPTPEFVFEQWAEASPVSQFKAISCLLHQCSEGKVPSSGLYDELNRVAGELAQRILQDLPEYQKASWGN